MVLAPFLRCGNRRNLNDQDLTSCYDGKLTLLDNSDVLGCRDLAVSPCRDLAVSPCRDLLTIVVRQSTTDGFRGHHELAQQVDAGP